MKRAWEWGCGVFGRVREHAVNAVLAVALVVGMSGSAMATPGAACTALNTAATATVENAINCMIETVAPNAILVTIVTAFVPILLVIWGARGGFALVATVVRRMFGFLTGRA